MSVILESDFVLLDQNVTCKGMYIQHVVYILTRGIGIRLCVAELECDITVLPVFSVD